MESNVFSLIITGILAIAAMLAYLVQRARYLREIEPDLELKWPDGIRVARMGSELREGFAFYIDIEVENRSRNHAEDLRYEVDLRLFPNRDKPQFIAVRIHKFLGLHPDEILAGRKAIIPIYVGTNIELSQWDKLIDWGNEIVINKVGFTADIRISYSSKHELLLWFLIPWKFGRLKCIREILGAWSFEINKKVEPPYVTRYWEHPSIPREVMQSVTSGKPW